VDEVECVFLERIAQDVVAADLEVLLLKLLKELDLEVSGDDPTARTHALAKPARD
jgi:hypothetical protein